MPEEAISVRIPSEKKAALDAIAAQIDRDVSFVIEEDVNAYLDLHAWQRKHIKEGLRQADAGDLRLKPRSAKHSPDGSADDRVE